VGELVNQNVGLLVGPAVGISSKSLKTLGCWWDSGRRRCWTTGGTQVSGDVGAAGKARTWSEATRGGPLVPVQAQQLPSL
jgi:hypothetical protein